MPTLMRMARRYGPKPSSERFSVPRNYNDTMEHFRNFADSMRSRKAPVEDAVFGFRAAGAALLSNESMQRNAVVQWNPETMKLG